MECNTVSLVPRTTQFLSFSWSCTMMHRSGEGGGLGASIMWMISGGRGRIYDAPGPFLGFQKWYILPPIHRRGCLVGWNSTLLHPPTPGLGPTNPPSGNPGYGPVAYVSLSSSISTTQQHGEKDSKEAGRQLSSFTNLGGSANVIPCMLTPWARISWRKTHKNSNFYWNKWHHAWTSWMRANHSCQRFIPKHANI